MGSTNRQADAELVAEMQRFASGESFDERPMPALGSEALDFRVASELFAPVRKLTRRNLETLRLLTSHQGRPVPTVGGVLLCGRDRLTHFPDAWIQAGRFDGTDKAVILDLLEHGNQRSTHEIAGAIGLSPRATRTRLAKLVARGLVREIGTGPRDPKRRYIKASD